MFDPHSGHAFHSNQVTNQRNAHTSSTQRYPASSSDPFAINLGLPKENSSFYPKSANMNMSQQDINTFSQGTPASSQSFSCYNLHSTPFSLSQLEMPSQGAYDSGTASNAAPRISRVSDLLGILLSESQAGVQRTIEAVDTRLQGLTAERDTSQLKTQERQLVAIKELFESAIDAKLKRALPDFKKALSSDSHTRKRENSTSNKEVIARLDTITRLNEAQERRATERSAAHIEQLTELLERIESIEATQKEQRIKNAAIEAILAKFVRGVEELLEHQAATLSAVQELTKLVTARPARQSLDAEPTIRSSGDACMPLKRIVGLASLLNEGGTSLTQSDCTISSVPTQHTDSQLASQSLATAVLDSSDTSSAHCARRSTSKRCTIRSASMSVESDRKRQRRRLPLTEDEE